MAEHAEDRWALWGHLADRYRDVQRPHRILALDGGGIRGIITLGVLRALEDKLRVSEGDPDLRLCDYFDLIGGTSTGAIIAAGLSRGMSVAEISDFYARFGRTAFSRRAPWNRWRTLYARGRLAEILQETFGAETNTRRIAIGAGTIGPTPARRRTASVSRHAIRARRATASVESSSAALTARIHAKRSRQRPSAGVLVLRRRPARDDPRVTSAGSYRVSTVVDRSRFPKLFRFVEWRIDVQFAEARELLRLPMPEVGLESGQTFAAAASLVNLIAGASVWFTTPPRPGCLIGKVVAVSARRLPPIGRGMTARSSTEPKAYACSMSASAIRWRMVSACPAWTTRVRRSPFSKSR